MPGSRTESVCIVQHRETARVLREEQDGAEMGPPQNVSASDLLSIGPSPHQVAGCDVAGYCVALCSHPGNMGRMNTGEQHIALCSAQTLVSLLCVQLVSR